MKDERNHCKRFDYDNRDDGDPQSVVDTAFWWCVGHVSASVGVY